MATQVIPISDRATWLELRRRDLTASDVAAVAGLNPRRSALAVYEEKIGMTDGTPDNDIMRRGRWLEPAVLAAVREMRPEWDVRPARVYLRDSESRLGATPDAFALIPGVGVANLQCKVVAAPEFEEHWADERVPTEYVIQTVIEAALGEAATAYIAALVISTYTADLVIREVPRHAAAERRARAIAVDFWQGVATGLPPPVDFAKDQELIASLPATPGKSVDLSRDPDIFDLLAEYERLAEAAHDIGDTLEVCKARIQLKLSDAEEGLVPGWQLTWKESNVRPHFVAKGRKRTLRVRRKG